MTGDFRKLQVWEKAHALALRIDRMATAIRLTRYSALRSQLTRAAMSIPANIAEGRRQSGEKEFARFLRYAVNSAYELEYHLVVAQDVGAVPEAEAQASLADLIQIRKMIHGLLRKLGAATDPPNGSEQSAVVG